MDIHIPKTKQNQRNKNKRPNYMMKKAVEKVKDKKKVFSKWRETRAGLDYKPHASKRTQAKWSCHQAEKELEKKIHREAKHNLNASYRYAQSNLKTLARIADLKAPDGTLHTALKEKADLLNNFP